jgi:hypothetical protein
MAKNVDISEVVEHALARALDGRISQLRDAIKAEVLDVVVPILEKVEGERSSANGPGGAPTDVLSAAVTTIYDHSSQADILRSLLDGVARFTQRAVLLVNKGGKVNAWQSRGFEDESALKGFSVSASEGLAGRAIQDKEDVSAAAAEFDEGFVKKHGNPADGNATVLPLIVRGKVAAAIYADAGVNPDGKSDLAAVRVLVRSASAWLEIIALRKAAGSEVPAQEAAEQTVPTIELTPVREAPVAQAAAAVPAGFDVSGLTAEEQDIHKKAKRFAKLLVDEIKLYNQAKVAQGRANKDLYQRLREDIDKSRATYDKRYGATPAASGGYFTAEVIRVLADDDVSVLGSGFSQ